MDGADESVLVVDTGLGPRNARKVLALADDAVLRQIQARLDVEEVRLSKAPLVE